MKMSTVETVATLVDLPVELILTILKYVPPDQVLRNVAPTCKVLYEATKVEWFWEIMCKRHFGIRLKNDHDSDRSAKLFFKKILLPYGQFLGLWSRKDDHYGSLHQVVFDGEWGLMMVQWFPPPYPNVSDSLRAFKYLTITIDWDSPECDVRTQLWDPLTTWNVAEEPITATIRPLNINSMLVEFEKNRDAESEVPIYRKFFFRERGRDRYIMEGEELLYLKFSTLYGLGQDPAIMPDRCVFEPVEIRLRKRNPYAMPKPIQPGLFKGTYGPHGIEIVELTYQDATKTFHGKKITGDPNVPREKITFRGELTDSFGEISVEDQMDFSILTRLEPQCVNWFHQAPMPFRLPNSCYDRAELFFSHKDEEKKRFRFSKSRFRCLCQVAGHGYRNAEEIDGHFVVFDDDTFGVIFFQLRSFTLFHRVKEKLSTVSLDRIGTSIES